MSEHLPVKRVMISEFLPPDYGAVGQYCDIFCRRDAESGMDVTLVGLTSGGSRVTVEKIGAGRLTMVLIKADPVSRASLGARAVWTMKANARLILAALPHMRRADEVHFTGSPPFLIHFLVPLNWILRKRLVYLLTDFYPEFIMAHLKRVPLPLRALFRLTCLMRRQVTHFQVLGFDQEARLREIGIPDSRISIRRDLVPVEIPSDQEPLARPAGTEGKALLLYSGNLGHAHDVDTFADAYIRHHRTGSGRVVLWLNAVGDNAALMVRKLEAAGAPVIHTKPVPIEKLAGLLVAPDAHLITLKNEFVGYVLPSKTYGCIESGLSVLFVGPTTSDVHYLCDSGIEPPAVYYRADIGDVDRTADALEAIADAAEARRAPAGSQPAGSAA